MGVAPESKIVKLCIFTGAADRWVTSLKQSRQGNDTEDLRWSEKKNKMKNVPTLGFERVEMCLVWRRRSESQKQKLGGTGTMTEYRDTLEIPHPHQPT